MIDWARSDLSWKLHSLKKSEARIEFYEYIDGVVLIGDEKYKKTTSLKFILIKR